MHRFALNRWWAFILALGLTCASVSTLPTRVSASQVSGGADGGGSGGGTGTGIGDPDNPSGKTSRPSRMLGGAEYNRTTSMGDGARSVGVGMSRLQVVLQILKRMLFRF